VIDPAEPEVAEAAGRARAILDGVGSRPMLDRLDRAMSELASAPVLALRGSLGDNA